MLHFNHVINDFFLFEKKAVCVSHLIFINVCLYHNSAGNFFNISDIVFTFWVAGDWLKL